MKRSSVLVVTFVDTFGMQQWSRSFDTLRAARKWAGWLRSKAWCSDVCIWDGLPGGMKVV